MSVSIEESWKKALSDEFKQPYFKQLTEHLRIEKAQAKIIYPPGSLIFHAFNATPLPKVKVVLLGQDPYHGPKQAHGLSFSVPKGVPPPPSLVNIFKELEADLGLPRPPHGNLEHWAKQGVLLLNAALTVRAGEAGSHSKIGWHAFTDAVISTVSQKQQHVVFLLWGKFAQQKRELINEEKHLVLTSAHPSPLSANTGFFGNHHFSKTNAFLMKWGMDPIGWTL